MASDTLFFIEQLSPLYEAVQTNGIFPDSKFFPDCTPKCDPTDILKAYEQAQIRPDFDLKKFVETHFDFPQTPENEYDSADKPIVQHLDNLWNVLLRQGDEQPTTSNEQRTTLIPLPHTYIVPGGRFREIYYWDSYFTMLGLQVSERADVIQNMVDNFAYLIDTVGFIPNGNRTYYLGRSQPPFFALMVNVLAEAKSEDIEEVRRNVEALSNIQVFRHPNLHVPRFHEDSPETLSKYRPQLEKEYAFWMAGENDSAAENPAQRRVVRLPDGSILNRYWDDNATPRPEAFIEDVHVAEKSGRDPATVYRHIRAAAESGWDFSSRWFKDGERMETIQTTDLLPIDLNCLLYFLEKTLVHAYRLLPDHTPVEVMKDRARTRRAAIQKYFWNDAEGFYFDYNFAEKRLSDQWMLAAVFPLFFQIAEMEQAEKVAQHLANKFLHAGGVATTLTRSGQQWDAPNGWAPLQWMTFQGLRNYGFDTLAAEIRRRWLALNEKTYASTGRMMEKYNVMDPEAKAGGGEYPNQDGFGWTNGVYLKLRKVEEVEKG